MIEIVFLYTLALIWIIFATIQDLKKREVANWLNFSLIIFALGFRLFFSLFSEVGFRFLYEGLIGLGIFFILGNLLYYGKLFAGGDAKLFIALGAVLPFSTDLLVNIQNFITFLLVFFIVSAVYSFVFSLSIGLKNFKRFRKEFGFLFRKNRKLIYAPMFLGLLFMVLGFVNIFLFILGIFIFILPYFYIYAKAVDEAFMIKKTQVSNLREGDWLYRDVRVGGKTIKTNWDGLKKKEIRLIRKEKKFVLIRQGIPFTPVFLFGFLIFIYLVKTDLLQSFGLL